MNIKVKSFHKNGWCPRYVDTPRYVLPCPANLVTQTPPAGTPLPDQKWDQCPSTQIHYKKIVGLLALEARFKWFKNDLNDFRNNLNDPIPRLVCRPWRRLPASSPQTGPSSHRWESSSHRWCLPFAAKESRLNLGLFFEREKSKWEIGLLQRNFPTDPRFFPSSGMLRDIAGRECGQVP